MPKKKRAAKSEKTDWDKTFEVIIGTVLAFAVVAIIFAGFYFVFGTLKRSMSANVVEGVITQTITTSDWGIITILTAFVVCIIVYFVFKKEFIKIKN